MTSSSCKVECCLLSRFNNSSNICMFLMESDVTEIWGEALLLILQSVCPLPCFFLSTVLGVGLPWREQGWPFPAMCAVGARLGYWAPGQCSVEVLFDA